LREMKGIRPQKKYEARKRGCKLANERGCVIIRRFAITL
jgi:hypothetical protein